MAQWNSWYTHTHTHTYTHKACDAVLWLAKAQQPPSGGHICPFVLFAWKCKYSICAIEEEEEEEWGGGGQEEEEEEKGEGGGGGGGYTDLNTECY